jgi:nucleoid DNA-binding protein
VPQDFDTIVGYSEAVTVANLTIDDLPPTRAVPFAHLPDLTLADLEKQAVTVHRIDDPEMGPIRVAALEAPQLGTTAMFERYELDTRPGFTLSFFEPPAPNRASVRRWLRELLGQDFSGISWLHTRQTDDVERVEAAVAATHSAGFSGRELVEAVVMKTGLEQRQAEAAVLAFIDSVVGEVEAGNTVTIFGFGTFRSTLRTTRTARNPQTGARQPVAASRGVRFSPASAFRSALNTAGRAKRTTATKATGAAPAKRRPVTAAAASKARPASKGGRTVRTPDSVV